MATVTKPMALDETLQATNIALGLIKDAINATGSYPTAQNVSYDNATSGLNATNVQSAINELNSEKQNVLTQGANIAINGNTISATDTTYDVATTSANGLMSSTDKTKLNGIESNANNYSLPTASADTKGGVKIGSNLSMSGDTLNATDTTYSDATTTVSGLMSAPDKTKLNGIATGAEVNQNAFSNVKVGSTTVSADSKTDTLELVAGSNVTLTPDATNDKVTIDVTDTTYSNATTSVDGLMSASDKTKLDGIATNANNYSLPTASATVKGGIKIGSNLSMSGEVLSATDTTYSNATTTTAGLMSAGDKTKLNGIATNANNYSLPTASASTKGGVKIGSNLSMSGEVLSATDTTYDAITKTELSTGTATTKRTVTASVLKSAIIDIVYPVGTIYTSNTNTNPSTYFGGTWASISESLLVVNNGTTQTTQYKWKRTA